MTGWALMPALLPFTKLLLPTTNRRVTSLSIGKPMLYFLFDASYGSQETVILWSPLSLTRAHHDNFLLQDYGLKTLTKYLPPATHEQHAQARRREPAPCKNQRNSNRSKTQTETRLTETQRCCMAHFMLQSGLLAIISSDSSQSRSRAG